MWILGGVSVSGQIAIYTGNYISVATYNSEIKEAQVKVSNFTGFDEDSTFYLDPERVEAVRGLSVLSKVGCFFLIYSVLLVALIFNWINLAGGFFGLSLWVWFLLPLFEVCFMVSRSGVAGWHGAEHKAIYAYRKTESSDFQAIVAAPRVSRFCGSRFIGGEFFLGLIFSPLFFLAASYFSSLFLIFLLSVLWIIVGAFLFYLGLIIGDSRAAIFMGNLLQYFITTKEPSEIELKTAQAALIGLILAEEDFERKSGH